MSAVLVHIDFPYAGPWSDAMARAYADLAADIAAEPGLLWKLWLENEATQRAGGAYLFADRAQADRYLDKHRARLAAWGMHEISVTVSAVNAALSAHTKATDSPALPSAA